MGTTSRIGGPSVLPYAGKDDTHAEALAEGRHPARIGSIDLARNGAAAAVAAQQDGATEVPPPNDVWIRNENSLVRTLPTPVR